MRTYRTASALTLLSIMVVGVAAAQTAPQNSSTAPDSASSPHQRAATSNDATEAPANNPALILQLPPRRISDRRRLKGERPGERP